MKTIHAYDDNNVSSSSGEDLLQDVVEALNLVVEPNKPIELKTPLNSKIARAMMFVKNNKITHNFELKLYLVTDEKGVSHKVELLPKPKCTCLEKRVVVTFYPFSI